MDMGLATEGQDTAVLDMGRATEDQDMAGQVMADAAMVRVMAGQDMDLVMATDMALSRIPIASVSGMRSMDGVGNKIISDHSRIAHIKSREPYEERGFFFIYGAL